MGRAARRRRQIEDRMDERFTPRAVAPWYMAGAAASLLVMLVGCAVYTMHLYTDPASLPLDQRVMFEAEPPWVTMALGIAAAVGTVGAVMLLLRRKAAVAPLPGALLGAIVLGGRPLAPPPLPDLLQTDEIAVLNGRNPLHWGT